MAHRVDLSEIDIPCHLRNSRLGLQFSLQNFSNGE